ncbi:hypothetical protein ACH5A2_26720 [Streptomyces collinus]|uniref:hypothetical protein n=1 Tax=Streptomyces collinus TaxID=42684 RepID=UPI003789E7C6
MQDNVQPLFLNPPAVSDGYRRPDPLEAALLAAWNAGEPEEIGPQDDAPAADVPQADDSDALYEQCTGDRRARPIRLLARACQKYGLLLEFISPAFGVALTGVDVSRPEVRTVDGVASYFLPARWDIVDALHRLPAALRLANGQGVQL